MREVAALFVREDSCYKAMPGVDAWDIGRDARNWPGGLPVVAHPPCRAWGLLRQFAKPRPDEKELAILAVAHVRQFGGVLEHPARSSLWNEVALPKPGEFSDEFGGYTLEVDQFHWGHKAQKRTWLYIVGSEVVPAMPRREGQPTHVVKPRKNGVGAKIITKPERERTPPPVRTVACGFGKKLPHERRAMSDDRITLKLSDTQSAAPQLSHLWQWIKTMLNGGHRLVLTVRKETRSLAQNALMWSCLTDLSEQVKWDGVRRIKPEGWKDYLTAHLNGQDLVPNMDGTGFVAIGRGSSTSDMTIAEMTAVIELAHAFGTTRDVQWRRTSLGRDVPDECCAPKAKRRELEEATA